MHNRTTLLVIFCLCFVAFLAAISLRWFTDTFQPAYTHGDGAILAIVTGLNGSVTFLLKMRIWWLLILSASATAWVAGNFFQRRRTPTGELASIHLAGFFYALALSPVTFSDTFHVGPGLLLAVFATMAALLATWAAASLPSDVP